MSAAQDAGEDVGAPSQVARTAPTALNRTLTVVIIGSVMSVLDMTIVNVALPSLSEAFRAPLETIQWTATAYTLALAAVIPTAAWAMGRIGAKRAYLTALVLFTLGSLLAACAWDAGSLIAFRAVQGLGGGLLMPVGMAMVMRAADRALLGRAMALLGLPILVGPVVGPVLGGRLIDAASWHWIFLVNLPVGVAVFACSLMLLPAAGGEGSGRRLDAAGAVTVTAALMLAVYAIVNGNGTGWTSAQTLGLLAGAAALLGAFLVIESRAPAPLMPLGLFRLRNVATANVVGVLWAAAMFAWFFLSALYLQIVLGYSPLQVGLAFLPANLIMAAFSIGISARVVMRFGLRAPLGIGLGMSAVGLALFARAPVAGSFAVDVLPSMILLGFGAGMALNPVLLAAMSGVAPEDSGLASGVVNTSFMMGGALGLAVLASIAASRTERLRASGDGAVAALNGGYHAAFLVGAVFAAAGGALGALLLRNPGEAPAEDRDEEPAAVAG
jgi:EmrB/QacA subfamily drug resistance transporter